MPRPRLTQPCIEHGCPNTQPCPLHARKPWANATERRPDALRGRALQKRNATVIAAHGGRCHVCGLPGATQVDHVVPYAQGGGDDWANLAPIHPEPCHRSKTATEAAAGR